jgi:hypothetical protein
MQSSLLSFITSKWELNNVLKVHKGDTCTSYACEGTMLHAWSLVEVNTIRAGSCFQLFRFLFVKPLKWLLDN